jgi:Core-2/I-Branching enzyme
MTNNVSVRRRRGLVVLALLLWMLLLAASLGSVKGAEEDGDGVEAGQDDDEEEEDEEYAIVYKPREETGDVHVDEEMEEEIELPKDEIKPLTEHQINLGKTYVDLSGIDLSGDPATAAAHAVEAYSADVQGRLASLFAKTRTPECRALIAEHFGYHLKALAREEPLPFASIRFNSTCQLDPAHKWDFDNLPDGIHMGHVQNRTYQPPRNESVYISPFDVVLCYGVLAHDNAAATIRLIEAVDEPTTHFVVHIDAKYEMTHRQLRDYASQRDRVFVLDHPHRAWVNWGGFSMVNATLLVLRHADRLVPNFTHFVHIASTAYPIASNRRIRNTIADYPVDANLMHVILKPARPHHAIWNYYVECDDRLHRIHRLPPLTRETHGADFYTSSQWFIISRDFARYLANPEPGDFLSQYLDYIRHAVVADENFFGTVLLNSRFCNTLHNWHFLHLTFDQWENEREVALRDERKCVMPDPNHCGRSPTTISLDYLDILELSGDLYARKFMDDVDVKVKDVIDTLRMKEEFELVALNVTRPRREGEDKPKVDLSLDGYGTLIVARETVNTSYPLCMGLGPTGNKVRLVPCFKDWVPPTLAQGWETGGVIWDEVQNHTRWQIGPCSSDGNLVRT